MVDVSRWLAEQGLGHHAEAFAQNGIAGDILRELTDADLKELGLNLGDRKRLLKAIATLNATPTPDKLEGAEPTTRPIPRDPERRQLTVMFVDLVGSTELSGRLDPEEMREVLRDYQNAVAGEVTRFEGQVAKYMGDGVLAYFGWPRAHEDEAERAVRAGLAIVDALAGLETPAGAPLAARIGIATGLVMVGELIGAGSTAQEQTVVGETPNVAARLQTLAAPGSVVISQATRGLVGGLFALADLGPQRLKGFAEPLAAWRVEGEGRAESRFEALHGERLTPLVGREHELGILLERWAWAKDGDGQVVLLSGEPGIGKSRMIRALRERLGDEPYTPLSHYCSPYHVNSALHPVIGLLERAAWLDRDEPPEEQLIKIEALLSRSSDRLDEVVPLLAALLGVPTGERYPALTLAPDVQKRRTWQALVDQLAGLAAHQPVLALYEDVHWIDPSTLELLGLVIERIRQLPVLLLITFRPEFQPPWTAHAHVTTLTMSRLGRRQGADLVTGVTGDKPLPVQIVEQIVARTDGVPLFVEELTKTVLESDLLADAGDHYDLSGPLPPLAIPTTLHDSLMARLDRLASVKEVAQIGAVVGREFSHELLAAVAPISANQLGDALKQLVASELVFRRGAPPEAIYTFKHALIQDAAYQSLLKSKRQQLHARIAQVLEEQFPEIAKTGPEILARHYTKAGLVEKALRYWSEAGQLAAHRSAYSEAIAHLRSALQLAPRLPDEVDRIESELRIQAALGDVLIAARGYASPEAGEAFARARELCGCVGETPHTLRVLFGQFRFLIGRADFRSAHEVAERLLSITKGQSDRASVFFGHRCLGISLFYFGQFAEARLHLERAFGLLDSEQQNLLIERYGLDQQVGALRSPLPLLPVTLYLLGYPSQAAALAQQELAAAEHEPHPFALGHALYHAAWHAQLRRDRHGAKEHAAKLASLALDQSFAFWLGAATVLHGWALGNEKPVHEGIAEITRGIALFCSTGAELWMPYYLALLAETEGRGSKSTEGLRLLAEALGRVESTSEDWIEPELHRLKGEILLRQPAAEAASEAEACFRRSLDIARKQSAKSWELRAATSLARLWRDRGRRAEAYDLLAPVYGWFTEGFDTADLQDAKALLDALA